VALTYDELVHIAPASAPYAQQLMKQMAANQINTPRRIGCCLGQIAEESGLFTRLTESLNYSRTSPQIAKFIEWGRLTPEQADRWCRIDGKQKADQRALANQLYGGAWGAKNLGNQQPDDGWNFRGRGLKQLTGRDNYRAFSRWWLGGDGLLMNPDRVAQPDGAVASAMWFWMTRGLNEIADTGDVRAVTKKVNGGSVGLNSRIRWTKAFTDAAAS
jgi:putative chitinase